MFYLYASYGQRSSTTVLPLVVFALEEAKWIKLDFLIAGVVRPVTVLLLIFGGQSGHGTDPPTLLSDEGVWFFLCCFCTMWAQTNSSSKAVCAATSVGQHVGSKAGLDLPRNLLLTVGTQVYVALILHRIGDGRQTNLELPTPAASSIHSTDTMDSRRIESIIGRAHTPQSMGPYWSESDPLSHMPEKSENRQKGALGRRVVEWSGAKWLGFDSESG